ncbi:MAG: hypothetical protein IH875_03135 [Candidatus Dadabacteria bacterium]|nr:hypothetical protein [Candidatus Dadabacteria bacterium]
MRSFYIVTLSILSSILFPLNSFAETEDLQIIRGQLACVQLDEEGKATASKEFTECSGLLYLIGVDGNLYSLHGSEEEVRKITERSKSRMGYRLPLRLKGKTGGHQRAWHLYTPSFEPQDNSVKTTVAGSVLCVFSNYEDGNVNPVIAHGPCNEYEPHAHFIQTDDGQMYALHGPYEKIISIEKNPQRENVTLSGKIQGNESGWIFYVD